MAVSGTGTCTVKSTAAADTIAGPLQIQAIQWIRQDASVVAAADSLVLSKAGATMFEDTAVAGHLGGFFPFPRPLLVKQGETLTVTTMGHGAVLLHLL